MTDHDVPLPRRSGWDVWSYSDASMYIAWDVPSARIIDDEWPTPITWIGNEVSYRHGVGQRFYQATTDENPLHLAYKFFTKGRNHISGPQAAILCAIPEFAKEIQFSPAGRVLMDDDGRTYLNEYAGGRDRRMLPETSDSVFDQIDSLLLQ